MDLAKAVRSRLAEMGWSQAELARRIGMYRTQLSKLLSGNPTVSTLERVLDPLDLEVTIHRKGNAGY